MSLARLFHFLCAQHVTNINISIIRSLRLFCWITTLVVCSWFDVCWSFGVAGLEWYPCSRLKKNTTDVAIQQNSRKLLMLDILMFETCWAHKKWNKNSKRHQVGLLFLNYVAFIFVAICSPHHNLLNYILGRTYILQADTLFFMHLKYLYFELKSI